MNRRSFFTRFAGFVALVGVARHIPQQQNTITIPFFSGYLEIGQESFTQLYEPDNETVTIIAAVGIVSIHTLFDRMRFYEELVRSAYLQPNDIKELEC